MSDIIQRHLQRRRERRRERRRRNVNESMRMLLEEQDRRIQEAQQLRFQVRQVYYRNLLPERQPDTTPPDEPQIPEKHNWIKQGY